MNKHHNIFSIWKAALLLGIAELDILEIKSNIIHGLYYICYIEYYIKCIAYLFWVTITMK